MEFFNLTGDQAAAEASQWVITEQLSGFANGPVQILYWTEIC